MEGFHLSQDGQSGVEIYMTKKLTALQPYFGLLLTLMACHGLLLMNDGIYWDDWLSIGYLKNGDWQSLSEQTSEMGLPLLGYFQWTLKLLNIYTHYKIIAFLLIYISSVLIYKTSLNLRILTATESFLIAVIFIAFPAYQVTVLFCTLNYLFCLSLFYLAAYIYVESLGKKSLGLIRMLRVGAATIFFISFNLNSLLVYFYAFLMLMFFSQKSRDGGTWIKNLSSFIRANWPIIILPIAYWVIRSIFTPPHGLYANYHRLDVSAWQIFSLSISFIRVSVFGQFFSAARDLGDHVTVWLVLLIGVCVAYGYLIRNQRVKNRVRENWFNDKHAISAFGFGLIALICAIFPYAAVGLSPESAGFGTRHNVLISLPVAILIISVFRIYSQSYGQLNLSSQIGFKRNQLLIISSVVLSFALSCNHYYISWEARAIKDRAFMHVLQSNPKLGDYATYWIDDRFQAGPALEYSYYEYSSMFKEVWGGESRIGVPISYLDTHPDGLSSKNFNLIHRYNLRDYSENGKEVILIISPKIDLSEFRLVKNYYANRISSLFGVDKSSEFLGQVLSVEAIRRPNNQKN